MIQSMSDENSGMDTKKQNLLVMNSVWNIDVDEAFKPMFDQMIGYRAVRGNGEVCETSYQASVFPIEDSEVLDDVSIETDVKKISVIVLDGCYGWNQTFKPQVGDVITLDDDSKWSVSKVTKMQTWWNFTAKSKE